MLSPPTFILTYLLENLNMNSKILNFILGIWIWEKFGGKGRGK
jgi:hypothetical protein